MSSNAEAEAAAGSSWRCTPRTKGERKRGFHKSYSEVTGLPLPLRMVKGATLDHCDLSVQLTHTPGLPRHPQDVLKLLLDSSRSLHHWIPPDTYLANSLIWSSKFLHVLGSEAFLEM